MRLHRIPSYISHSSFGRALSFHFRRSPYVATHSQIHSVTQPVTICICSSSLLTKCSLDLYSALLQELTIHISRTLLTHSRNIPRRVRRFVSISDSYPSAAVTRSHVYCLIFAPICSRQLNITAPWLASLSRPTSRSHPVSHSTLHPPLSPDVLPSRSYRYLESLRCHLVCRVLNVNRSLKISWPEHGLLIPLHP